MIFLHLFLAGYGRGDGVGKRVLSLSFFIALVYTTIQVRWVFVSFLLWIINIRTVNYNYLTLSRPEALP